MSDAWKRSLRQDSVAEEGRGKGKGGKGERRRDKETRSQHREKRKYEVPAWHHDGVTQAIPFPCKHLRARRGRGRGEVSEDEWWRGLSSAAFSGVPITGLVSAVLSEAAGSRFPAPPRFA